MKFPTLEEAIKWSLGSNNRPFLATRTTDGSVVSICWFDGLCEFAFYDKDGRRRLLSVDHHFKHLTNFRTLDEDEKAKGEIPERVVEEMRSAMSHATSAPVFYDTCLAILAALKVYHAHFGGSKS